MMRKVFLWAAGSTAYAAFMIGYLLLLTLYLPSILIHEPDWIEVGSFAEYTAESVGENGTYTWRIISIQTDVSGERIARINRTYTPERINEWRNYSSSISDISLRDGIIDLSIFWFNRYYNVYLVDLSDFMIGDEIFGGESLAEISVRGQTVPCIWLKRHLPSGWGTGYCFDRESGLLLYRGSAYHGGFYSRIVLKNTNIPIGSHHSKAITDLLIVSPLFMVPIAGVTTGLHIAKKKKYTFSIRAWLFFIIFNGIILGCVANFPARTPWGRRSWGIASPFAPMRVTLIGLNAFFWILVVGGAMSLIDDHAFPIIQKKQ